MKLITASVKKQAQTPINQTVDAFGFNAFMHCCKDDNVEVAKLLLDKDVNYNKLSKTCESPLHICCRHNSVNVLKLLIEKKDICFSNRNILGQTPLHLCCYKKSDNRILSILAERKKEIDFNAEDEKGNTAFIMSCFNDRIDLAISLLRLEPKININHKNKRGYTAFSLCCITNSMIACSLLKFEHLDYNVVNDHNQSGFYFASVHNHTELLKKLIHKKDLVLQSISRNQCDHNKYKHICTRVGLTKLIKPCPFINACDYGRTELWWACYHNNISLVRNLINKKVDVNRAGPCGKTPIYVAAELGNTVIIEFLLKVKGIDYKTAPPNYDPLFLILCSRNVRSTGIVMKKDGVNIDVSDGSGKSAFWWVCYHNNVEFIKEFIKRRNEFDWNKPDNYKRSPFFVCCYNNYKHAIKLFFDENDFDPSIKEHNLLEPAFYWSCFYRNEEACKLFLKYPTVRWVKNEHIYEMCNKLNHPIKDI